MPGHKPWVIGHRGASGHAPENTLAAFRRAAELGAAFIETDLHLSRDGHLVVIHDAALERTTNGRGLVCDFTLAELRKLDAGSWFHPTFAGETIPTLEEVLAFGRDADVALYLEIKYEAVRLMHRALVGALRDVKDSVRAVVLSFEPATLDSLRELDASLLTGLLFDRSGPDHVALAQSVGARQLAPRGDFVTPSLVARARRADLQVATWTLNEPEHMRAVIAAGVDGVMTDYPDRLCAVVSETPARD